LSRNQLCWAPTWCDCTLRRVASGQCLLPQGSSSGSGFFFRTGAADAADAP
jgi:hypothetical protein